MKEEGYNNDFISGGNHAYPTSAEPLIADLLLQPLLDKILAYNGTVNVTDLLNVIANWNQPGGPADVNFDGIVNVADLLIVIGSWGPCSRSRVYTAHMNTRAKKIVTSLVVFVLVLVVLNIIFSDMNWGIHISIVGSVVLTLVVWGIMAAMESGRG